MAQQTTNPAATSKPNNGIRTYNMQKYLDEQFSEDVENFRSSGKLKSGYPNLDAITTLYPGLYVLGAISSLGKTTFIHQMCDQIAKAGDHVLFFSIEQSALELASKSISRTMAEDDAEHGLTSLQIRRSDLSDPHIQSAIKKYMAYSDRMTVVQCSFRATIYNITQLIKQYIQQFGIKPVVIIDYLQVIQADPESHKTTKDLVDFHVQVLKKIQSDYQLTMIVISSLNRQNYMTAIDFESFKESGGIEYTADVLWGLQLQCIHEDLFSKPNKTNEKRKRIMEAKCEYPRKVELICLKNRFGVSSYACHFDYYPNFDWFEAELPKLDISNIPPDNADCDGWVTIPPGFKLPFD